MGAEWWGRGPATESPIWPLGSGRSYLSYTRIMVQRALAERRSAGGSGKLGPRPPCLRRSAGIAGYCRVIKIVLIG